MCLFSQIPFKRKFLVYLFPQIPFKRKFSVYLILRNHRKFAKIRENMYTQKLVRLKKFHDGKFCHLRESIYNDITHRKVFPLVKKFDQNP